MNRPLYDYIVTRDSESILNFTFDNTLSKRIRQHKVMNEREISIINEQEVTTKTLLIHQVNLVSLLHARSIKSTEELANGNEELETRSVNE